MPKKQPLGRKHKAGTGNNSTAPATRIISKTKMTTVVEISTKNAVRQVVRDLEKKDREREFREGLFQPVRCFAGSLGVCDAIKFWWHEEPGWGCSERPIYRAGVFHIDGQFVRATASQRAAFWKDTSMDPRFGPKLKQREWQHGWFGSPCVRGRAAAKQRGQQAAMRAISGLIACSAMSDRNF